MYRMFTRLSAVLIAGAILLLVVFKLIGYTGMVAAGVVGISALLGGILLIVGSIGTFADKSSPREKEAERLWLMLELICVGVVFAFGGFLVLYGGFLK